MPRVWYFRDWGQGGKRFLDVTACEIGLELACKLTSRDKHEGLFMGGKAWASFSVRVELREVIRVKLLGCE